MAVLDPRVFDLIEALTAAGMDWLAFELFEAMQAGRTTAETSDTLAVTRRKVREGDQPQATGEPTPLTQEPQPIEGDDQIEWAAKYVAERLEATLAYLSLSLENVDVIAGGDVRLAEAVSEDAGQPVVVLVDGEVQRKVGRAEVDAAIAALPQLRRSLEGWSMQVRGQTPI